MCLSTGGSASWWGVCLLAKGVCLLAGGAASWGGGATSSGVCLLAMESASWWEGVCVEVDPCTGDAEPPQSQVRQTPPTTGKAYLPYRCYGIRSTSLLATKRNKHKTSDQFRELIIFLYSTCIRALQLFLLIMVLVNAVLKVLGVVHNTILFCSFPLILLIFYFFGNQHFIIPLRIETYIMYRSGTVNSNTVNSKFHLIRSFFEIFAKLLPFHV